MLARKRALAIFVGEQPAVDDAGARFQRLEILRRGESDGMAGDERHASFGGDLRKPGRDFLVAGQTGAPDFEAKAIVGENLRPPPRGARGFIDAPALDERADFAFARARQRNQTGARIAREPFAPHRKRAPARGVLASQQAAQIAVAGVVLAQKQKTFRRVRARRIENRRLAADNGLHPARDGRFAKLQSPE